MPVQAPNFDGSVVLRREASFPSHGQKPEEDSYPHDHVQSVQSRHHEVEGEENLGVLRIGILAGMAGNWLMIKTERGAGNMMVLELLAVLDPFNAKEDQAEYQSQHQIPD